MRSALRVLAAGAALAGLVALAGGCRGRQVAPPRVAAVATPTPEPVELVMFYPGDDDFLHRERREIPELPASGPSRVKAVVEELLSGSRDGYAPAFPWPATVETAFVDGTGNAYVDFSAPPSDAVEGTSTELAMAYATVHTVVANCPGVARVQLLFGGHQVSTFGHLDLSRPLAPRPELVAP
jgi:hypothetical protein